MNRLNHIEIENSKLKKQLKKNKSTKIINNSSRNKIINMKQQNNIINVNQQNNIVNNNILINFNDLKLENVDKKLFIQPIMNTRWKAIILQMIENIYINEAYPEYQNFIDTDKIWIKIIYISYYFLII